MDNEKNVILADLYAIRAGLSVISQYTDEIKSCENSVAICKDEKEDSEAVLQETATDEIQFNKNLQRLRQQERDVALKLKQEQAYLKKEMDLQAEHKANEEQLVKKQYKKKGVWLESLLFFRWYSLIGILSIPCFIACLIAYMSTPQGPANEAVSGWFTFFAIVVAFYLLSCIIVYFVFRHKGLKEARDEINELIESDCRKVEWARQKTEQVKRDFEKVQEEIKKYCDYIEVCKEKKAEIALQIKATEKTIKERELVASQQTSYYASLSKDMRDALVKSYSGLVNESDWQNVDLLIYYLETGRADSVKDGLLLVDRQLQADQITKAITQASSQIQSSLKIAFENLGAALTRSFSIISSQIADLTKETRKARRVSESIIVQNDELLASNERIISATEKQTQAYIDVGNEQIDQLKLNNALLEKANESSVQLMQDLRYGQQFWLD